MFFSAGDKENPVSYEGDRTLEALKKFVDEHDSNASASDKKEDL